MNIEVHRSGRTYYAQTTVLLNIPRREFEGFLAQPDWQFFVAAKFLGMRGFEDRPLRDFAGRQNNADPAANGIPGAELDALMGSGLSPAEIVQRLQQLRTAHQANTNVANTIAHDVCEQTGVQRSVWQAAGPELLEAVIPLDDPRHRLFSRASANIEMREPLNRLGLGEIALVQDYTILNATFGFSRSEYAPDQCWLNPFAPDRNHGGRLPIFVDRVQADALLVSLDPERVLHWLAANGMHPTMPPGTNPELARRSYFVRLFDGASLYHTLTAQEQERRLVFGLLHSLSHQCVKQAALMCGLEKTSLSEYILPKALTVAIYPNHRFGATLGALTALFEQTLLEWLEGLRDNRVCVYDPVCRDHGSNCHACTHLPETSCRFYNLNLSRSFLFGGHDSELGFNIEGYFVGRQRP